VAGDAARALDSLSGAGIINAMMSGKLAGMAAAEYLSNNSDNYDDLEKLYPGRFLEEKGAELKMYSKLRGIYNRLTDDDFAEIVTALDKKFAGVDISGVNAINVLTGIITGRPGLIRLVRYLF
jgi:digeranylgeranylglycerophospholipid reductase